MILPDCSDKLDFEGELAVVIGKTATNVRDNPLDHVAGYCCFNDGTIRDYQRKTTQWTAGKNFDRTGAFSADLVTPDELPRGASGLRLVTRLNGEIMQDGNTADLIFDVADADHHAVRGDDAGAGRRDRHRDALRRRLRAQASGLHARGRPSRGRDRADRHGAQRRRAA